MAPTASDSKSSRAYAVLEYLKHLASPGINNHDRVDYLKEIDAGKMRWIKEWESYL